MSRVAAHPDQRATTITTITITTITIMTTTITTITTITTTITTILTMTIITILQSHGFELAPNLAIYCHGHWLCRRASEPD